MQISVAIIAKNEAENLKKSLPRLHWCNDIVVIDDNSTDETAAVASLFGARVIQRAFDGFGTQKQFAVAQTKHLWVLNIDADEVLSDNLIEELKQLPDSPSCSAYDIPVRHVFMGKAFQYGKESRFFHTRLFRKDMANFDAAPVHEKVQFSGNKCKLSHVILHYSYKDLQHYFTKLNAYSQAGALRLKAQGRSRPLLLCLAYFPVYFIKHYFAYGNILNGLPGFIWSYLNAWYHTVKYLKLLEMNRNNG